MLWYLPLLRDNPEALLIFLAALLACYITGIAFHEFSHAASAYQLGDPTAARLGRLTLNPFAHLDPLGLLMLFLVGFGWGKPTPVNLNRLRNGPRAGGAIVAFAGPLSNFVFAILAALPLKLGLVDSRIVFIDQLDNASGSDLLFLFLYFLVLINVLLGIFNLIPLAPLDGFKVAVGILPREPAQALASTEQYGMGILLSLIALNFVTGGAIDPIGEFIEFFREPIFEFLT
jgi:Zn-dependent protease